MSKAREIHNLFRRRSGFNPCQLKYTGRGSQVVAFSNFVNHQSAMAALIQSDQLQHRQQQPNVPSPSFSKNRLSNIGTSSVNAVVSSMPLGASGFQSSLFGMQDSSELLHSAAQVDPSTPTRNPFVKVYKSGSVGRSLDISRFSSYNELQEELGQMFGIEGLLKDPQRSDWICSPY